MKTLLSKGIGFASNLEGFKSAGITRIEDTEARPQHAGSQRTSSSNSARYSLQPGPDTGSTPKLPPRKLKQS